ncbi:MAG: hypothetical protein K2F99_02610 [Muribaculaceae bacterium]|nr:hypothetical protein [Muribaculaceae bacterium]
MVRDYVSEMVLTANDEFIHMLVAEDEMDLSRELVGDIAPGDSIIITISQNEAGKKHGYYYMTIIGADGFQVLPRNMIPAVYKERIEQVNRKRTGVK